jgi:hypothetical protein
MLQHIGTRLANQVREHLKPVCDTASRRSFAKAFNNLSSEASAMFSVSAKP